LRAKLAKMADAAPKLYEQALRHHAEAVKRRSMKLVPFDLGALHDSHAVIGPTGSGRDTEYRVEVGGPTAPYAFFVHEDPNAFHPRGQWKYLETASNELEVVFENSMIATMKELAE